MWRFQVPFQCFDVAVPYFEEIFLDIKKKNKKNEKTERVDLYSLTHAEVSGEKHA